MQCVIFLNLALLDVPLTYAFPLLIIVSGIMTYKQAGAGVPQHQRLCRPITFAQEMQGRFSRPGNYCWASSHGNSFLPRESLFQ